MLTRVWQSISIVSYLFGLPHGKNSLKVLSQYIATGNSVQRRGTTWVHVISGNFRFFEKGPTEYVVLSDSTEARERTTKTQRTQRGKAATEKIDHKGTKTPRPFFWIVVPLYLSGRIYCPKKQQNDC